MKLDDRDIQLALRHRLSGLTADPARRARIRAQIMQEEEPVKMKRKMSVGLVLALVALLAMAGVALAVGLNLFEHFGGQDPRYEQIAPLAEITPDDAARVESDALGTATASIVNAYFDGDSLMVGYRIENAARMEVFTPTAEQLQQMTSADPQISFMPGNDAEAALVAEYAQAKRNGTPFGLVKYAVYPSDHTETDDGIDLGTWMATEDEDESGAYVCIREYETPLPEAIRNRDALSLRISLYEGVSYLYFDGQNAYVMSEQRDAGAMTATVARTAGESRRYTGTADAGGTAVTFRVDATAMRYTAEITAGGALFDPLPEDSWYDLRLRGADGASLRVDTIPDATQATGSLTFTGTGAGSLPDSLTAELIICAEGDGEPAVVASAELTPEK